jgi:hypothetical protein
VAGLLWILRYIPDEEHSPPEPFEVADSLESSTWRGGIAA